MANDVSLSGNPLTAFLDNPPSHGTLTLNPNGSFLYTPTTGYLGTDSFTYHANDTVENSNVASVSLNVISFNTQLLINGSFESNYTGWNQAGNQKVEPTGYYAATNGSYCVLTWRNPRQMPRFHKASRRRSDNSISFPSTWEPPEPPSRKA